MKLVLASQSVWRKKLFGWLEMPFVVMESGFDEKKVHVDDPEELVATLALKKAETVAADLDGGIVIGADTVIVIRDTPRENLRILGKPNDADHAREMLTSLRGRKHEVFTGVVVLDVTTEDKRVEVEVSTLGFKDFSDEVLEEYLQTDIWEGKAGAYQLLAVMDRFVESVDGSVTGVIGLPLKRLSSMLEEMGVEVEVDSERVVEEQIGFRD